MIRQSLLVALIAVGLAGCNTSYNYFQAEVEEEETEAPGTLFGAVMKRAGMIPDQNRGIEHKPRAPLAMPGSNDLPSPDETQNAEAVVNFPTDDDDARRERARRANELGMAAAYERQAAGATTNRVSNAGIQALPAPGEFVRRETGGEAVQSAMSAEGSARLNRQEMKTTIRSPGRTRNQVLTDEGQAMPRQFLVQPPDEYRTPSQTAELPEKKDIENSKWVKDRLYKREDKRPARMIK
ncbi:MAG: hypothetical protein AAGF49_11390 [Pseudomonadota bacterium]